MAQTAIQKSTLFSFFFFFFVMFSYMSHLIREEKQATGAKQQPSGAAKRGRATGAAELRACGALAKSCQERSAAEVYLSQIHISPAKQQPNVLTERRGHSLAG